VLIGGTDILEKWKKGIFSALNFIFCFQKYITYAL
jgi:hypothetical protein